MFETTNQRLFIIELFISSRLEHTSSAVPAAPIRRHRCIAHRRISRLRPEAPQGVFPEFPTEWTPDSIWLCQNSY